MRTNLPEVRDPEAHEIEALDLECLPSRAIWILLDYAGERRCDYGIDPTWRRVETSLNRIELQRAGLRFAAN